MRGTFAPVLLICLALGLLAAVPALAILAPGSLPFDEAGAPRGVHVSLGDDARTMATVAWFTDSLADPGTVVEYGPTPKLGLRAEGISFPAPGVRARVHEALLTGLAPGGEVHYRVGGASGWSPVRAFHTAPTGDASFRFTVFGDHGTAPGSRATTAAVLAARPDLHLVVGDLAYADGKQAVWDAWFGQVEPLAATVPFMPAPGNHEYEGRPGPLTDRGTETFRARFALPDDERYYSFDYANVHFLALASDPTTQRSEGVLLRMAAFAQADLGDAARRRDAGELDFLVVYQHHPLHSHHATRGNDERLIRLVEPWLVRYGVDLLLVGHNHQYERSHPIQGYVQVVTGGGGKSLHDFVPPDAFGAWSAVHAKRDHFLQADVDGPTMTLRAIATDGPREVLDAWTLRAVND